MPKPIKGEGVPDKLLTPIFPLFAGFCFVGFPTDDDVVRLKIRLTNCT